jgi:hypothetical protein
MAYAFTIFVTMWRRASLSDGVDVRTAAGPLGHRNAATTLNVYAHVLAETDRDAARQPGVIFSDALARSDALGFDYPWWAALSSERFTRSTTSGVAPSPTSSW